MTSQADFLAAYNLIQESYKKTKARVDEAIRHEEQNQLHEAVAAYESCIALIDDTFALPVGLPDHIDEVVSEWHDACKLIQKLKSVKSDVNNRLDILHAQQVSVDHSAMEATEEPITCISHSGEMNPEGKPVLLKTPNTFYEALNTSSQPPTYGEVTSGLRHVIGAKNINVLFDTLFQSQAKLYKIKPDGIVSTITGETSMSVVMCTVGENWQFLNGTFFIQCSMPSFPHQGLAPSPSLHTEHTQNMIWIYPLLPYISCCYRTEYGAFILPDMESDTPGTAFGIILIEPTANRIGVYDNHLLTDQQQFLVDLLEAILAGEVRVLEQTSNQEAQHASGLISKQLVNAGGFIAQNLIKGAEKTGELMSKTTPYILSKIQQAPDDAPAVSSKVQTSVEVAKNVTCAAASATGWIASKVGSVSLAVGRYLSPHVQTQGAAILEKGFGYDNEEANRKVAGALTIAAGAIESVSTVYYGLETSAKILGINLSQNSVRIIEHKYGQSASNVAAGTFDTIGNAFNVSQNVNYLTPKGLAKKMVKNTGKAVVSSHKHRSRIESQCVPAGLLYSELRSQKEK